ncbi:hypothetical protein E4P29_18725 [Rhodococcus sp. 1R11]|uniref:hypothetical protein n=1 Tax=Rhodococcus sp. 1R11 TaxID=2559614 RepID=UPI0010727776|nr:hypothetical protein [Rhodococcus sp. 1R11]TFI42085.1 hypothetical protein E4P29_18725 [Rhodococcus sp. 1R11]
MTEEVGYFALDARQQIDAPIVITEGGIAIGGTAVPGIFESVTIDPAPDDTSEIREPRTVTVKFVAEGGVVLNAGLRIDPRPDGSIRVSPPSLVTHFAPAEGGGTPSP